ncbi:cation-transporting P-type ATPase [Cupriavidus lacunae]|uniref:cation-transporting P-type ATPase n=1 Tax=Cupriavidus lacunae TaxID=2666307 RepID=UPI001FC9B24E|nr:cation-transporting P-type ATPase [Cupriavidus lacunae]
MPAPAVKTDLAFWQLPVAALLEQVATSPDGLSSAVAASRLAQFGPNLIHGERKRALILQFLTKFRNPLVIILLTASALSAFTGDTVSFFIIGTIVIISVSLDFVQEYRAGQAADRLRQSVAVRGQVLRDGKPLEIPIAELVPGDVALLTAGVDPQSGQHGRILYRQDRHADRSPHPPGAPSGPPWPGKSAGPGTGLLQQLF